MEEAKTPPSPMREADVGLAPPPIWPPLPPGPPPPPEASETNAAAQLDVLFRTHQITAACTLLGSLPHHDAFQAVTAVLEDVQSAPYAFLLALHHWPPTSPRNTFFMLLNAAIKSLKERDAARVLLPPEVSTIAGSLLLNAFADARPVFAASFGSTFRVSTADLQNFCMRALGSSVTYAVTVVDSLDMRELLPLAMVIDAAIKQNDLHGADLYVRGNRQYQLVYIEALIDQRQPDKLVKKRMTKFGIDEQTFPAFYERRMRSSIRYLIHTRDYEEALRAASANHALKLYAAQFVVDQRGADDLIARLFVHRAGVGEFFPGVDTTDLEGIAFPNIFEFEPLAHCLSLPELIGEANCEFVETPAQLLACVAHLRTAPVVGFDCEWKSTTAATQATSEACAVLQLASATHAFVVDMIALKADLSPLFEVLQSSDTVKLGFDAKGDVQVLNKVLPATNGPVFENLVDIQALAKQLQHIKRQRPKTTEAATPEDGEVAEEGESPASENPAKQNGWGTRGFSLSLTNVAEAYLGKPLDKRVRMSNWEQRPLSKAQLHYAALDAYVLVIIFAEMHRQFSANEMETALAKSRKTAVGAKPPHKKKRSTRRPPRQ